MAVLDREGDQPSGAPCNVPGQRAAEPGEAEVAVRIVGDGLVRAAEPKSEAGRPAGEVLDAGTQSFVAERGGGGRAGPLEGVGGGVEEQRSR
ncbi:hypothetical protein ABZ154_34715 [Streptomyces sp. NPDC006261]|uniref:hypothetical protein n=1 Tax=Streptomyces sp. NPDC006261 TaxID=3156739 RepID=UPI0033BB3522